MVPFPEIDGHTDVTMRKVDTLKYHLWKNPDFHGILTPPMREEVKKARFSIKSQALAGQAAWPSIGIRA
jgi:hypothetical protein